MNKLSLKKLVRRQKNYLKTIIESITPRNKTFKSKYDVIAVIGKAKTGTSSVKVFLKSYGSKHLTINRWVTKKYLQNNLDAIIRLLDKYNSVDDKPWNRLDIIEKMMKLDMNIGFIYTYRCPNERFNSIIRYGNKINQKEKIPMEIERKKYKLQDENHMNTVKLLSKKFNKDVLFIDVTQSKNTPKTLHQFIGLTQYIKPFPHINKT